MADLPKLEPYDFVLIIRGRINGQSKQIVEASIARDFHIPIGYINAVAEFGVEVKKVSPIIGADGVDPRALRR